MKKLIIFLTFLPLFIFAQGPFGHGINKDSTWAVVGVDTLEPLNNSTIYMQHFTVDTAVVQKYIQEKRITRVDSLTRWVRDGDTLTIDASKDLRLLSLRVGGVMKFQVDSAGNSMTAGKVTTNDSLANVKGIRTEGISLLKGKVTTNDSLANIKGIRTEGISLLKGKVTASDSIVVTKGIRNEGPNLFKGKTIQRDTLQVNSFENVGNANAGALVSPMTVTTNAIGTMSTTAATANAYGLSLRNMTPAINGTQQDSPPIRFRGYGYGTTASTSQSGDWRIYNQMTQSTVPASKLMFDYSANSAAYVNVFNVRKDGLIYSASDITTIGALTSYPVVSSSSTDGIVGYSSAAASAGGTIRMSPRVRLTANVWDSTATAASKTQNFTQEVIPVSGGGGGGVPAPSASTARLRWSFDHNGGGYSEILALTGDGRLIKTNGATLNNTGYKLTTVNSISGCNKTTVTFTAYSLAITDAGANGAHGSVKLIDFPEGHIKLIGAHQVLTLTRVGTAIDADAVFDAGIGSITAGVDNEELAGTETEITGVEDEAVLAAGTLTFDTLNGVDQLLDGSGTSSDAWLNVAVAAADCSGNDAFLVTGTVTITWVLLGDD